MREWTTAIGRFTFDEERFCVFTDARDARFEAAFPFRAVYDEVPCLRSKTLENHKFRILNARDTGDRLTLRLKVEEWFVAELAFLRRPDGFSVVMEPETLVELSPNMFRVLDLDILPGFFSAAQGEDGYFLLPHFCGALMRFNVETEQETRDLIYGEQALYERYVAMPVCGMKKRDAAWLCIAGDGRHDARITVESRRRRDGFRYRLTPSFVIRRHKADPALADRRELHYSYFPDPDADYNRMAVRYREHLMAERGIPPLAERMIGNPALQRAAKSSHVKVFMGMKLGRTFDGEEEMTVAATFADTERMAAAFKDAGVDDCLWIMTGWNPGGHDGAYPTRFPVEPKVGGEEGFRSLRQTLDRLGHQLTVHDNHADAYRRSPLFAHLPLLTDRSGEPVGGSQWGGGATYRLCPAAMPLPGGLADARRMKALGVNGIYYLDNMGGPVFTCHDPKHPANRRAYAAGIQRLTGAMRDLFGGVAVESYQDYALDRVDLAWKVHAPFREMIAYFDHVPLAEEPVPFFQVAWHGLLMYHAEYGYVYEKLGMTAAQASAMEIGLGALPMNELAEEPCWYLPGWRETLARTAEHHRRVVRGQADRQTVFIDSIHMDRADNRIATRFADGVRLECDLNAGTVERKD